MQKVKWIAVVLAMVCVFACSGSGVEGTYYNVANDQESIELRKDGQFHLKAGAMKLSGKYVVDGKTITLNTDNKMAARGTIENGLIVDNDGTKWQRK